MIRKKLRKSGASYCLLIEKAVLDILGIEPDEMYMKVTTEDGKIIIEPEYDAPEAEAPNGR